MMCLMEIYHHYFLNIFTQPEDLNISTSLLNLFKTDPGCVINETAISNNYCYVLPKYIIPKRTLLIF